jgi:hypothetical protein
MRYMLSERHLKVLCRMESQNDGSAAVGEIFSIKVTERHLKRLLTDYVSRTHLGLNKETPNAQVSAVTRGRAIGESRLGGLHHR